MASGILSNEDIIYTHRSPQDVPWHTMGIPLPGLSTAQEVAEHLSLRPYRLVGLSADTLMWTLVETHKGVYDDATNSVIGVVGNRYSIVQDVDVLKALDCITADPGGPKYTTAAKLWGGADFFAAAEIKLEDYARAFEDIDPVQYYLVGWNNHTGQRKFRGFITATRPVCNNTVSAGYGDALVRFEIPHVGDVMKRTLDTADALGLVNTAAMRMSDLVTHLMTTPVSKEQVDATIERMFPGRWDDDCDTGGLPPVAHGRTALARQRVRALFDGAGLGSDLRSSRGTAWGLFNAFSEYADHLRGSKSAPDARLCSSMVGKASKWKNEALDVILRLHN